MNNVDGKIKNLYLPSKQMKQSNNINTNWWWHSYNLLVT